jgi:DNA-binding response OmpR family regulator
MTRILVVDDDPAIREMVTLVLMQGGFEVIEAASALEARQTIRSRTPDLILLD